MNGDSATCGLPLSRNRAVLSTVRPWSRAARAIRVPVRDSMVETRRTASSECPPMSKKSSCMPTGDTPSTSSQMACIDFSASVRGATKAVSTSCRAPLGAGNALRSILPLGVRGIASTFMTIAGNM